MRFTNRFLILALYSYLFNVYSISSATYEDEDTAVNSRCDRNDQNLSKFRSFPAEKNLRSPPDHFLTQITSEDDIALHGHLNGIKPVHYDLHYDATDLSQFEASVLILVKVIAETRLIAVNVNSDQFEINSKMISIKSANDEKSNDNETAGSNICIRRVWTIAKEQLLVIELMEDLESGQCYRIKFDRFAGKPKMSGPYAFEGLLYKRSNFSAHWTTIFEMRLARTVFPCFDHPSLKATFRICIKHPNRTVALGPMPLEYSRTLRRNSRVYYSADEGKPERKSPNFHWQIDLARRTLEYLKREFGLETNLSKLAFLNLNDVPYRGLENFGLIVLQEEAMRDNPWKEFVVIHEIIHHWVGNLVTVGRWDEICMQEALTTYFDRYLAEKLGVQFYGLTNEAVVRLSVAFHFDRDFDLRSPIAKFNQSVDIVDRCFGFPVNVFYSMGRAYGEKLLNDFLIVLVDRYMYSSANLRDWTELIDRVYLAGNSNRNSRQNSSYRSITPGRFLESWFIHDGYPISYVKLIKTDDANTRINIVQKIFSAKNRTFIEEAPFKPLFVDILMSNLRNEAIFVDSDNFSLKIDNKIEWIVLDPNQLTFSRVIYCPEIYRSIIDCFWRHLESDWTTAKGNCPISDRQLSRVLSDLFYAMRRYILISKETLTQIWANFEAGSWRRAIEMTRDITLEYPNFSNLWLPYFYCCLTTRDLIDMDNKTVKCANYSRSCVENEFFNAIGVNSIPIG